MANLSRYNNNMNVKLSNRTVTSPLVAWLFALLSLAIVVVAIFSAIRISKELQAIRTFNALVRNISSGDSQASAANVEELLKEERLVMIRRASEGSRVLGLSEFMNTTRELHHIIISLRQGNFENALHTFNVLLDGRLQALIFTVAPGNAQQIKDLQASFQEYQLKIKKLSEERESIPKQIKTNLAALRQLNLVAKSLAIDFANLFALTPIFHERSDALIIDFYQSGVLKGLPVLKGIPDDLMDLAELKQALEKAGGEVQIKGANTQVRFQTELTQFGTTSEKLQAATAKIFDENRALEQKLQGLASKLFTASRDLEQQVSSLLLEVLYPQTSPETVFISRHLKFLID